MNPPLPELLRDLARPEAWPPSIPAMSAETGAEVVQTHISAVFLARDHVLKLKKPVRLAFVDFSARSLRLSACEAECLLNARLAPDAYLGVVTVGRAKDGRWAVQARAPSPTDESDEPAVLMRRLPADRTMASLLRHGALGEDAVRAIGRRIAEFHAAADAGPSVQQASCWDAVAGVIRTNLAECAPFAGRTLQPALHERLIAEAERELIARRELVDRRARAGMGRDGHGDLRLDHVYVPERADEPVVIIDCIEFRDDFRQGDPVGDVAFLVMELRHAGRKDLADALFDAWRGERSDDEASELLPLYLGHRHAVRGKVRSIEAEEVEVPRARREKAAALARGHFLAALGAFAPPARRPALVLACGLPGSGKSTVARALSRDAGFVRVSSDVTRRELRLAGVLGEDSYSVDATDRTYAACTEEARSLLLQGARVVVDASFHEAARRGPLLALGAALAVPTLLLHCPTSDEEAEIRLAARTGDESEADAAVRALLAARWEAPTPAELTAWREVPTGRTPADAIGVASTELRLAGIL